MEANYFTILYWFCHTSTWIRHGCTRVPHTEPPSHLPPRTIPLGHPSAPAPVKISCWSCTLLLSGRGRKSRQRWESNTSSVISSLSHWCVGKWIGEGVRWTWESWEICSSPGVAISATKFWTSLYMKELGVELFWSPCIVFKNYGNHWFRDNQYKSKGFFWC